jgi:pyrimidine-nucleoside phosphorylase
MDAAETLALTRAMMESGARLTWPEGPPVVDKHSTGGIGDKSSLILAPLLASCGVRVPMISGRGLGPTGGTLDKLESIPGFRTDLPLAEMQRQVDQLGVAMIGQTAEICPADKKLYALRDASATVASVPLITASILSKKLAEGLDALVLDIKYGSGAFMKTREEAERLSQSMQKVLTQYGLAGSAHLNSMEQPTGRMVGHVLEVIESIDVLKNSGPDDLRELVIQLATSLLLTSNVVPSHDEGVTMINAKLSSGEAFEKFEKLVAAQGGSLASPLPIAPSFDVTADRTGVFSSLRADLVGYALIELGGGRKQTADSIDPSVGFEFLIRLGDHVHAGQPIIRVFAHRHGQEEALRLLNSAVTIQ